MDVFIVDVEGDTASGIHHVLLSRFVPAGFPFPEDSSRWFLTPLSHRAISTLGTALVPVALFRPVRLSVGTGNSLLSALALYLIWVRRA